MAGMLQVEIMDAGTLDAAAVALWRGWTAANPDLASPYFHWEYAEIASRVCPGAAIAVFRREGEIVGFFPHQRRGGAVQPLAAPMNDYHGVIAFPGEAPDLATVARLLNGARTTVSGWVGQAPDAIERSCVQAVLPPEGFDAWYAERRTTWSKYFKDKERARRSLEAESGPIRVETGLRDPALLDHLIDLKRGQYVRTGRHDVFACGWTRDLLHALMASEADDFGASMSVLWAGDRLAACEFSLHAGDQWHFWFPAYEPDLARCSPGILLSMDTMRAAGALGYRSFDFGYAGEGYKKYFCNDTRIVSEAILVRPGLGASLSQAAVGLVDKVAAGRGEALRASVRRRWTAIEACEVTSAARLRGGMAAARAAINKLSRQPVSA